MRTKHLTAAGVSAALAFAVTGCGVSLEGGSTGKTIEVVYEQQLDSTNKVQANFLASMVKGFEKANPGTTVRLVPVTADENDYYTKIELMMRSSATAPDLVYEDTATLSSDVTSGYLKPLDNDITTWSGWDQVSPAAKAAVTTDGKVYGVPDTTDTRGIWYNKQLFAKAGIPVPWQPKTWADVVDAAKLIKAKEPGVIPLNVYTGTASGEQASMQGFEMLLYGTPAAGNALYDASQKKWVVGSQGFRDALQFVHDLYAQGLGPTPEQALGANFADQIGTDLIPHGKLAMDLDGSWTPNNWIASGPSPWPQWQSVMGEAAMPTQDGQGIGKVSMSGGWAWSIPAKAADPSLAWKFTQYLESEDASTEWNIVESTIPVRKDVAADPRYAKALSTNAFFSSLVPDSFYRPGLPVYPQVSAAIQQAMEAVTSNQSTVAQAAAAYDKAVILAVGKANTVEGGQ